MKIITLLSASILSISLLAQQTVTVTTGPANSTQTFYSLQNGVQGSAPLNEWDLAFEITGFTASILVNTVKGIEVYKTPYSFAQWASVDTLGMSAWTRVHNSDTSWSHGALNQGLTEDEFDLGWGVYNMITHTVQGDSVFVLKLANGAWKKLRIDDLASSTYNFTWADLDGSNETSASVAKSNYTGKNFAYYSLEGQQAMDREPMSADWDLLFTKYEAFVPTAYPVAGVLLNKGVTALRVDGVPPADAHWLDGPYTSHINTIGYDWKSFNMETFQYEYDEDLTFFVTDRAMNVWKLVFIGYGGSSSGDMSFTQEMVSAVGVDEVAAASRFTLFPNPVISGSVQLSVERPLNNARMDIFDQSGRMVMAGNILGNGSPIMLDIAGLSAGLYTVRIQDANGAMNARLVVE